MPDTTKALPAKPLSNRTIAMSVSETPDLAVLGMLEGEDKVFLGDALTPLLYSDARVSYGGRIDHPGSTNFTLEISGLLAETYRREDTALGERPMIQYLRAADAQNVGTERLFNHVLRLGTHSEIRLLCDDAVIATLLPSGRIVDVHVAVKPPVACAAGGELAAIPELNAFFTTKIDSGFPGMRRAMTRDMDARIIMGGAVARTAEGLSGVAAEALSALDAGKPLLIIGGVGGASRDIAGRLGLIDDSELVDRDESVYVDKDGNPWKASYDAQLQEVATRRPAFDRVIAEYGIGDDLRRLAISESHIEIGALVVTLLAKWLPQATSRL